MLVLPPATPDFGDDLERDRPIAGVLDRLDRSGKTEQSRAASALLERLVSRGALGSRAGYSVSFPQNGWDLHQLPDVDRRSLETSLLKLRAWIQVKEPGVECVITGHCSDLEEDTLALDRAAAVRDYFLSQGIDETYLRLRSHDPDRNCEVDDSSSDFNRRADIRIISKPHCYEVARAIESVAFAIESYVKAATPVGTYE